MASKVYDILHLLFSIGIIAEAWHLKWRGDHPQEMEDPVETEAEICSVQFRKRWFWSPKESARVTIIAKYTRENGKQVTGQLKTYPVRSQVEMYAPELLNQGTKVQIRYDRKRSHFFDPYFCFADPRYAVPEVSGEPRKVRISYVTLILLSLLILLLSAGMIYLDYFVD